MVPDAGRLTGALYQRPQVMFISRSGLHHSSSAVEPGSGQGQQLVLELEGLCRAVQPVSGFAAPCPCWCLTGMDGWSPQGAHSLLAPVAMLVPPMAPSAVVLLALPPRSLSSVTCP